MKSWNKSHTLILIVITLSGCAGVSEPVPEHRVQHYYAPMQVQGQQAQYFKPETQPTSQPRTHVYNTQGRIVGYIK
jgi:hypothetical protein